jgi:hypothetical protein
VADLSITATSVLPDTGASIQTVAGTVFGEAVTAGQAVYRKAADSKIYKAKGGTDPAVASSIGIALNGGAAGQPAVYQNGGPIAIGASTAAGTPYHCSGANFGGIAPYGDLTTGNYVTLLGYGDGAGNINMIVKPTGIQHA